MGGLGDSAGSVAGSASGGDIKAAGNGREAGDGGTATSAGGDD